MSGTSGWKCGLTVGWNMAELISFNSDLTKKKLKCQLSTTCYYILDYVAFLESVTLSSQLQSEPAHSSQNVSLYFNYQDSSVNSTSINDSSVP